MTRIERTATAKTDVRRLDKTAAMRVLYALNRFATSGEGDVKALRGTEELRLRIGDYRVFFVSFESETIQIRHVLHRKEAYR